MSDIGASHSKVVVALEPITDRSLLRVLKLDNCVYASVQKLLSDASANSHVVLLEDFASSDAELLLSKKFILIGPPYAQSKVHDILHGVFPESSTYSLTLKNWKICFDSTVGEKTINLAKLLSCTVQQHVTKDTTCYIAHKATSKEFQTALHLEKPRLTPAVIDVLWQFHRYADQPIKVNTNLISDYVVRCFENLFLGFTGCDDEAQYIQLKTLSEAHGAKVCGCADVQMTHVVIVNPSRADKAYTSIYDKEWFYNAISTGYAGPPEPLIKTKSHITPLKMSKTPMSAKFQARSTCSWPQKCATFASPRMHRPLKCSHHLTNGMKMLYKEIVDTEENYIFFMGEFASMCKKLSLQASSFVKKNFEFFLLHVGQKVQAIFDVHSDMNVEVKRAEFDEKPNAFAKQLIEHSARLRKSYMPYLNIQERLAIMLRLLLDGNPELRSIVQEYEEHTAWKKQKIADLLIRPVQRLAQIKTHLTECAKQCRKQEMDGDVFECALGAIINILDQVNQKRKQVEDIEFGYNILKNIDNLPHVLLSERNCNISAMATFKVLGCNVDSRPTLIKDKIICLLFSDDVLILASKRTHFFGFGSSQGSITEKGSRLPVTKYLYHWPLLKIRAVHLITIAGSKSLVLGLVIRTDTSDQEFAFLHDKNVDSSANVKKFAGVLAQRIFDIQQRKIFQELELPLQDGECYPHCGILDVLTKCKILKSSHISRHPSIESTNSIRSNPPSVKMRTGNCGSCENRRLSWHGASIFSRISVSSNQSIDLDKVPEDIKTSHQSIIRRAVSSVTLAFKKPFRRLSQSNLPSCSESHSCSSQCHLDAIGECMFSFDMREHSNEDVEEEAAQKMSRTAQPRTVQMSRKA